MNLLRLLAALARSRPDLHHRIRHAGLEVEFWVWPDLGKVMFKVPAKKCLG